MVVVAFSSRVRILGECSTIHSPPALVFFFFFKVEISSRKLVCFIDNMIIERWVIETVWFVNS